MLHLPDLPCGFLRWSRLSLLATVVALPTTILACEEINDPNCTDEQRPGVRVEVRDSISGASIVAGTTLLLVAGTYRDSVTAPQAVPPGFTSIAGAHERAGSYAVTVKKNGYADWHSTAVVRADECHVQTVSLLARLQRL